MSDILKQAHALTEQIVKDRRHIHQNPEGGEHLPQTTAYIIARLKEMGYNPQEICESGIVATVGKPGKVFMLRADTDALPMEELSGLPFASSNGFAHTCGHDTHTAMLLGAAKILKDNEDKLAGTVKLMFQPNEEKLAGAKLMLESGLLENPKVDAALAIHISSMVECGKIKYSNGPTNASADKFLITVKGKGGHGSSPEKCFDPITVCSYIVLGLQEIIAREVAGMDTAVITVGHMTSGSKENIIPETGMMEGTIRTYKHEVREFIKQRVIEVATGLAQSFRCECEVTYPFGVAPNVNNLEVQADVLKYATELLGAENVVEDIPSMGSEDFALVAEKVPSTFLSLGAKVEDDNKVFSMHSPNVLFDEAAFPIGAATYATVAMRWLEEHK